MRSHTIYGLAFIAFCAIAGALLFLATSKSTDVPKPEVPNHEELLTTNATDALLPTPLASPQPQADAGFIGDDSTTAEPAAPEIATDSRPEDFPADPLTAPFMKPNLSRADEDNWQFRSTIREAVSEGPKIAGRYALGIAGCGYDCKFVFIVDGRTGKVIDFGLGGEENLALALIVNNNTSLIRARWKASDGADTESCRYADFAISDGVIKKVAEAQAKGSCPDSEM